MKRIVPAVLIAVLAAACGPSRFAPGIAYPCAWPGSPGFAGNIDTQGIVQPSGICYHPSRKTLFVASDEGDVFEIQTDGTPVSRTPVPGDLEDMTVDPKTGLLYVIVEGQDVILEFDPETRAVTRRFPINREFGGDPNFLQKQIDRYDNGVESLTFVPDEKNSEGGTFYAGNQEDPSCIMEISVPLKTARPGIPGEARIIRVLPFRMADPSAMVYDPRTKHLRIVGDTDNIFVEITLGGKLVREYTFPGNDQEGVAWDPDGFMYITQDAGGIIKLKDLSR